MTDPARSTVDLFAPDVAAEPYPVYRELRDAGPVVYLEKLGAYALTRYVDVRSALRDWETFGSAEGTAFNPAMNQNVQGVILTAEPPEHGALRSALLERLRLSSVRELAAWIQESADAMVVPLVDKGEFDVVTELARPFPAKIVGELIGLPPELTERFVLGSDAVFAAMGPMNARTEQALGVIADVLTTIGGITAADLAPGSMGEALYRAAERGEIPPEHVVKLLWNYAGPAFDTTIHAISNLIWALARDPAQFDVLREDPDLVPNAVDEGLRYEPTIQIWGRFCRTDVSFDGVVLPGGSRVAVLFGAANRDERHYPEPDRFDVGRNARDHLAFGYGMHRCTGASLAHLEIASVVRALTTRVRGLELGETRRHLNHTVRGFERLEVRLS
ncbi:cytochrome P450 [Amycolatopsis sp. K13G38]|uniref:Cytochrome P450 n=1 Tax=Amycolatopsis acididurans TaxID=2724524 RepID=A0ABX1JF12_9PSEU|nr:cytochrome P450 [Amycolatopsis acididurans]NKQ57806.1 cytochrome P450 [Amycolatopsis acididurans]